MSGEDSVTKSFTIFTYYQGDSGNQIKKNEIGEACSTYGREERCVQGFGGET